MIAFLILALHIVVSTVQDERYAGGRNYSLRHQLNVLRRRVPAKPRLVVADRLLFVWLYRLFPSVLNAVTIVHRRPSSGGIGRAFDCIGAGSRALGAGGRKLRWRSVG